MHTTLSTISSLFICGQEIIAGKDIYGSSNWLLSWVVSMKGVMMKQVDTSNLYEVASVVGFIIGIIFYHYFYKLMHNFFISFDILWNVKFQYSKFIEVSYGKSLVTTCDRLFYASSINPNACHTIVELSLLYCIY